MRVDWQLAPAGVFLFILPFTHTVALRLTCLSLAALAAVYAAWHQQRPKLPCKWPLVFWAVVCIASLAWSIDPAYSEKELRNEVGYALVAFLSFFYLTRDARTWRVWQVAIVASCAMASLAAIAHLLQSPIWPDDGLIGGRNEYSTYVVLAVPFLGLSLAQGVARSRWRVLVIVVAVLAMVSGYFTLNRTMWLALLVELLALASLYGARSRRPGRSKLVGAALVALACLVLAAAFIGASHTKSGVAAIDADALEQTVKRDLRWPIWTYAIERIEQRPLLGYGYGRGILRDDFRAHLQNVSAWHAHSVILNYALEAGVPGVAALLVLALGLWRAFWKLYREAPAEIWTVGAFGLALLLGAAAKTATDDIVVRENALLFWSLAGMSLGYARHRLAAGAGSVAATGAAVR